MSDRHRKLQYERRLRIRSERMPRWLEIVEITLIIVAPAAMMGMGFWFWR